MQLIGTSEEVLLSMDFADMRDAAEYLNISSHLQLWLYECI